MRSAKYSALLIGFAFLLSLFSFCANAGDDITNLVLNPEFIDGQQNWSMGLNSGAVNWKVESKGGVGDGRECVFIEVTVLPDIWWHIYLLQSNISLEKGKEYTYGAWARAEKNKGIGLKVQKAVDPWTQYSFKAFNIDNEWKEYWFTWVQAESQANCQILVFVESEQQMEKDNLWLDHIRLYEGEYQKDDLTPKAIEFSEKLSSTWGNLKANLQ